MNAQRDGLVYNEDGSYDLAGSFLSFKFNLSDMATQNIYNMFDRIYVPNIRKHLEVIRDVRSKNFGWMNYQHQRFKAWLTWLIEDEKSPIDLVKEKMVPATEHSSANIEDVFDSITELEEPNKPIFEQNVMDSINDLFDYCRKMASSDVTKKEKEEKIMEKYKELITDGMAEDIINRIEYHVNNYINS